MTQHTLSASPTHGDLSIRAHDVFQPIDRQLIVNPPPLSGAPSRIHDAYKAHVEEVGERREAAGLETSGASRSRQPNSSSQPPSGLEFPLPMPAQRARWHEMDHQQGVLRGSAILGFDAGFHEPEPQPLSESALRQDVAARQDRPAPQMLDGLDDRLRSDLAWAREIRASRTTDERVRSLAEGLEKSGRIKRLIKRGSIAVAATVTLLVLPAAINTTVISQSKEDQAVRPEVPTGDIDWSATPKTHQATISK